MGLSRVTRVFCVARADFILVYEEPLEAKKTQTEESKQVTWRNKFMKNLRKAGLHMEEVGEELSTQHYLVIFHGKLNTCPNWVGM